MIDGSPMDTVSFVSTMVQAFSDVNIVGIGVCDKEDQEATSNEQSNVVHDDHGDSCLVCVR